MVTLIPLYSSIEIKSVEVHYIGNNNNNNIANCVFYLTKKSNQPEDGS